MKTTKFIFLIISSLILVSSNWIYTRMVYMDKEIAGASIIEEIVIQSYSSRTDLIIHAEPKYTTKAIDKIDYKLLSNPDSIITYQTKKTGYVNSTVRFDIRPKGGFKDTTKSRLKHGYFPAVGDTVLVIMDSNKEISLFADKENKDYKFWSPYHNSSWNTIIFANKPFRQDTSGTRISNKNYNQRLQERLQERAKERGYDLSSSFHVLIEKEEFWKLVHNQK